MSFSDRVKRAGLPLDNIVVIGSGLLEAKGFREAHDIDLVVTEELFARLKEVGEYRLSVRHGEEVLERGELEIWLSFGSQDGTPNFQELFQTNQVIDEVHYIATDKLIHWKKQRATDQDLKDVSFLESAA